jgi:transcription elongation factor GreB
MSRAFTREDTWEEPVVPPRAPLPDGVPNYVTPRGLAMLRDEQAALEAERARLDPATDDETVKKQRVVLARRLAELAGRIAIAEVVDPAKQAHDKVRFGARVTLESRPGGPRVLQIVGVDEADPDQGRIGFTAPIARALLGKAVGESAPLKTGDGDLVLEVRAIEYDPA